MAEKNDCILPPQTKLGNWRTGAKDPTSPSFQVDCHRCDAAPQPNSNLATVAPLPRENMCFRASLCVLLLGFAITSSAGLIHRSAPLGSLVGLFTAVSAGRFALRNGYGTVEAGYHLTAYDCSDPSEVQAYRSIPASHCST